MKYEHKVEWKWWRMRRSLLINNPIYHSLRIEDKTCSFASGLSITKIHNSNADSDWEDDMISSEKSMSHPDAAMSKLLFNVDGIACLMMKMDFLCARKSESEHVEKHNAEVSIIYESFKRYWNVKMKRFDSLIP